MRVECVNAFLYLFQMISVEKLSATNSHSDLMAFFKSGQENLVGNGTVNMSESEARTLACDLDYGVQVRFINPFLPCCQPNNSTEIVQILFKNKF